MTTPRIIAQGLTFTYPGREEAAVSELDFSVGQGEIFGFLGPSGAGKSTTQKILTGLLKNYTGSAQVFGKDIHAWNSDYYERIGVSFELPNHYLKLTALENLNFFAALFRNATRDPQALLDGLGLGDSAAVPVGQFSKGMKTRLGIARALLHEPDILFMDEPTAGLDPTSAHMVRELIRDRREAGKTIFLTTHDMNAVEDLCDRAAFIVDGQIKLIDAPQSMKLRYGSRKLRVQYEDSDGRGQTREFEMDGLGNDPDFIALLRERPIRTMHTLEASLDEIFIQITGQSLA